MVQVADRIAPFFDDPLDSFRLAYSNDRWLDLRPDRS
jgi:hypothetical protein